MRLFIAINFDETTRQNILMIEERLRALGRGNFSRPENLHLTLAFLGEITPGRVAAIERAMQATTLSPMTLTFDRVGSFQRDGGDLWWISLKDNPPLLHLQRELCNHLASEGFILENRRFSPHITLARQVLLPRQPDRAALMGQPFSAQANTISLMRSERINGKLTYTEMFQKTI